MGEEGLVAQASNPGEELRGQAARQMEEGIRDCVRRARELWLELAQRLYQFHKLRAWADLGYDSFADWCASDEIEELEQRQIYLLIEVWREYVVERNVDPAELRGAGSSKLRLALPAVKDGLLTVEEAIADARTLSRSDIAERLAELEAGEGLDATRKPHFSVCPTCGSRVGA